GTIRSSGLGERPNKRSQPLNFHPAKTLARVGWTGTVRGRSVLVGRLHAKARVPRRDNLEAAQRLQRRVVVPPAQGRGFAGAQTAEELERVHDAAVLGDSLIGKSTSRLLRGRTRLRCARWDPCQSSPATRRA